MGAGVHWSHGKLWPCEKLGALETRKGREFSGSEIEDVGCLLEMEFVSCIPEVSVEVQGIGNQQ